MRKRSERSLVLFAAVFVFVCLLFSGGQRLIGHEGEAPAAAKERAAYAGAAFSCAPAPRPQTGQVLRQEEAERRESAALFMKAAPAHAMVLCDANGNVLRSASYLRAVYQAFVLDDGFA